MRISRILLPFIALIFLSSLTSTDDLNRIKEIHNAIITLDSHLDTPLNLLDPGFDISKRHTSEEAKLDIPKMKEGGLDAAFLAVFLSQKQRTPENTEKSYLKANQIIDSIQNAVTNNSNDLEIGLRSEDINTILAKNKKAIYLGLENGFPIGKDINRVEEFYNRGIRYITLSHTLNNDICDSSTDEAEHNGLSNFGVEVVKEMNRLGMMVDVSHISDEAFYNVLEITETPVIASHSSVRSLCDHPRNLTDDMIKALAENSGVIQICLLSEYIVAADTTTENYRLKEELRIKYNNYQFKNEAEQKQAWSDWYAINRNFPIDKATVKQAVDHIDYVVNLVGIDYVGVGSDFDGGGELADCQDVSQFPNITAELFRRGYSEQDIAKIWGQNFLRVFSQIEKYQSEIDENI